MALNEVKMEFSEFASKPASIIYVGIVALLLISEWKNPSNIPNLIVKVTILIISFVVVTVFNTKYFKNYWKSVNR